MYFDMYNLGQKEVYHFTEVFQKVPELRESIPEESLHGLSQMLPNPACVMQWTVLRAWELDSAMTLGAREENVASFLNRWNYFFLQGKTLAYAQFLSFSHQLAITNFDEHADLWVYVGHYRRIIVPAGASIQISPEDLTDIPHVLDHTTPIIVTKEIPVLQIDAHLYRKNDRGSYELSEVICARPGVYEDDYAYVEMLNQLVCMRGERNGTIYHILYNHKKKCIEVEATHRQPLPSEALVTPLVPPLLGLIEPASFPLRTRGKICFSHPCARLL
jgi:hypothetical protein